jgi:hypothetical protein
VVLTDPGLVEAERVHVLQQVEVGLEGQRGVVLRWVERCHEGAETQAHDESPYWCDRRWEAAGA